MSGTVHERDVADELHAVTAPGALAWWVVLLVGAVGAVASWSRARFVLALVDLTREVPASALKPRNGALYPAHLGVGVTQLDGDIADKLVLESDSHHA